MRRLPFVALLLPLLFTTPAPGCPGDETPAARGAGPEPAPGSGCPSPSCGPTPCTVTNPPFQRVPQMLNDPLPPEGINCFAVASRDPGYYLLLDSRGTTFQRYLSRNGIKNWFDQGPVTLPLTWLSGVQCPDQHFVGTDGTMYMYFNAKPTSGFGPWWVARTESSDHGATWSDPVAVYQATSTHFPYMPSVVEYGSGYRMAVSWWCTGKADLSEIHVLESTDGFSWTLLAAPALETGNCNEWDSGSVNRPRLVVDPDGVTLHMFYSGYPWDGSKVTRNCAKIGHAVSHDGGATWCENGIALEPAVPGAGWDSVYVGKPTLVSPAPGTLRLYYQGTSADTGGLGAAEASWPLAYQDACPAPARAFRPDEPLGGSPLEVADLPVRLGSRPNPTSGHTTLVVELARALDAGNVDVTVLDVAGRVVRRIWSGPSATLPARLAWDGRTDDGGRVAAGRYLARVRLDGATVGAHWITQLP